VNRNRWFALLILVAMVLFFLVQSNHTDQVHANKTVSVYNKKGSGLAMLEGFAHSNWGRTKLQTLEQNLLDSLPLQGTHVFALLSPKMSPSERVAEMIGKWVQAGGLLLLGFHDETTFARLRPILRALRVDLDVKKNSDFKNQVPQEFQLASAFGPFRAGERAVLYSPILLHKVLCNSGEIDCYFENRNVGQGQIVLMAGLPFFSNALLGKGHNLEAATRMLATTGVWKVDEYFHFFSDKTLWDLWGKWQFTLPMLGMLILLMTYFVFGHSPFRERMRTLSEKPRAYETYHDLNIQIAQGLMDLKSNSAESAAFHRSLLPGEIFSDSTPINTIQNEKDLLGFGQRILLHHRSKLLKKGKQRHV